jgi:hypothetical protein
MTYLVVRFCWIRWLRVSGVFSGQSHGEQSGENDALEDKYLFVNLSSNWSINVPLPSWLMIVGRWRVN